ncbi:MAG: CocE/NonD family hydrolase [Actinobacteria bacterium]|nr:CocE/NonD family hydrolase [Actinomycetota bacterium]
MGEPAVRVDDVRIPMRDGVALAADLITLDDEVPRPTLLIRSPYSRAASRAAEDPVSLARLGWAVVIQDVRGRFESEGYFEPYLQEGVDGFDTVEWCAAQPWCDGRVAGWGSSYLGATQLRAAAERPPALVAISPWVTSGWQDEGWTYEGGAFQLGFVMPWAVMMAASNPRATPAQLTKAFAAAGDDWGRLYRRALGSHPTRSLFTPFKRWTDQAHRKYWTPEATTKALRTATTPAFFVAGWFDVFCDATLRTYDAFAAPRPNGDVLPTRIVVGPWTHARLFEDTAPEMAFGNSANGGAQDVRGEALRFLRACVDGDTPAATGAKLFVMGANEWREFPAWPPASMPTDLFLADEGALTTAPPPARGTDTFTYDPANPVPTCGGRTLGQFLPMAGPVDQRAVETRDDVLVYSTDVLDADVTVIGVVEATIRFATTGRSADVTVKLVDVHPDGRAMNVIDSVRRLDFTPGRAKDVPVTVGATAMTFKRGHRIRSEVSSSNFPRLDRNPSTGVHWGDATKLESAEQTVFVGGARPSRLTLPVVS